MRYEIRFDEEKNGWLWSLRAENGDVLARGVEGYPNPLYCHHVISMIRHSPNADVVIRARGEGCGVNHN